MSTTLSLVSEMERIANALGTEQGDGSQVSLTSVAEKIAKNLGVRKDEVAILSVSNRWRHLHFLVPEALKKVGFIPLSSNSAGKARLRPTLARTSRPRISEKSWRSASLSASCSIISRASDPSAPAGIDVPPSKYFRCCRVQGRKCVDSAKPSCYFSTAGKFFAHTTYGGTANRHHGVRC